jgi:glycosyltransferase involved in cell wall biosynthesis
MASKNNSTPLRILFLARRYPPSVGGIQTHCYNLYHRLIEMCSVKLVALGRDSLLHLMWFVPYCFLVSLFCILFRRVDAIYFSDGVVCSIAPFLRLFTRMRFVVTIYGLEMTYSNPIFSRMMRFGVSFCDKVSVISQITRAITIQAGVPVKKIEIIYLGIDPPSIPEAQREALKARFEAKHGIQFGRDKIVLNFGRQVPRKGVAKFLECGVPLLDRDIKLIISGSGPDAERIREIWKENDLQDRGCFSISAMKNWGLSDEKPIFLLCPMCPIPTMWKGLALPISNVCTMVRLSLLLLWMRLQRVLAGVVI